MKGMLNGMKHHQPLIKQLMVIVFKVIKEQFQEHAFNLVHLEIGLLLLVLVMVFFRIHFLFSNKKKSNFKQSIDINECLTNNGGCSVNAKCTNAIGSFNCECKSGYQGNGLNCTGNSNHYFFFKKILH